MSELCFCSCTPECRKHDESREKGGANDAKASAELRALHVDIENQRRTYTGDETSGNRNNKQRCMYIGM